MLIWDSLRNSFGTMQSIYFVDQNFHPLQRIDVRHFWGIQINFFVHKGILAKEVGSHAGFSLDSEKGDGYQKKAWGTWVGDVRKLEFGIMDFNNWKFSFSNLVTCDHAFSCVFCITSCKNRINLQIFFGVQRNSTPCSPREQIAETQTLNVWFIYLCIEFLVRYTVVTNPNLTFYHGTMSIASGQFYHWNQKTLQFYQYEKQGSTS